MAWPEPEPGFVEVPVLARGDLLSDPHWRATSMSQLGGGLKRWATHLSQTGVFRGPDRPNIVETIGVSVTRADTGLLALSTCQGSQIAEGMAILRDTAC